MEETIPETIRRFWDYGLFKESWGLHGDLSSTSFQIAKRVTISRKCIVI